MPSIKTLQGDLLEVLKRTEFSRSHPEKMVRDIGELHRIKFCWGNLKGAIYSDKDYYFDCSLALRLTNQLLAKMK